MSSSPSVQLSATAGIVAIAPSCRGRVPDVLPDGHLVDPALAAVRAQDQPVDAALLEQLDLVTLGEDADAVAADLVGRVEQRDDVVLDQVPLATLDRADQAVVERQPGGLDAVTDRVGLARLQQRRPAPARHAGLRVGDVGHGGDRRGHRDGHRFVHAEARRGTSGKDVVVELVLLAATLGEDGHSHHPCGEGRGGDERRHELKRWQRAPATEPERGHDASHRRPRDRAIGRRDDRARATARSA